MEILLIFVQIKKSIKTNNTKETGIICKIYINKNNDKSYLTKLLKGKSSSTSYLNSRRNLTGDKIRMWYRFPQDEQHRGTKPRSRGI